MQKAIQILKKSPEARGPESVFEPPGKVFLRGADGTDVSH